MKVSCPCCSRLVWLEGADDDSLEVHTTKESGDLRNAGDECPAGGRQVFTETCERCGGHGGRWDDPCDECGNVGVVAAICYGAAWPTDLDHPLNSKPYNDRSDRVIEREPDADRDWIDPVTAGRFDVDALSALQRIK